MFGTCGVDPTSQIREALEQLAGEERAGWPGVALSERLLELSSLSERLEAEWLRCAGQWDAVKAWAEDGAVSASSWLASRTDVTRPNAMRKVRTARFAFAHTNTGDALASGELSAANAETLAVLATRRQKTFVGDEDVILEHAPKLSPDAFAILMRKWREYADDEEATHEESKPFEDRFFRLTDTLDGAKIDGFLDPEAAALVRAALDAIDRPDPTGGPVAARSRGQRYADALVDLAKASLAGATRGGRFTPNIDAVFDVNRACSHNPVDIYGDRRVPAYRDAINRRPVSGATIERLCCDPNIGRVIMRGDSEVLDLGRRSRLVTPAQIRALIRRDRHCQFQGCDRPPEWTDAHHLHHWLDGGTTDLDNLVLLCRRHHVLCHEGRWRLTRAPDGTITTTKPDPAGTPPPKRGPPLTLAA
jgi:hypothetical protein